MIYALINNNKKILDDYSSRFDLRIDKYISDSHIDNEFINQLNSNDIIIAENVLSLGSWVEEIVDTISKLSNLKINLYLIREDLQLKASELSDISNGLLIAHKIHRSLISLRSHKAIHERIAQGHSFGRPVNSFSTKKLDGKVDELKRLISMGVPLTRIAVKLNVGRSTIYNYVKNNQKLLREA